MTLSACVVEDKGVDTSTVVAYPHAQSGIAVEKLRLDSSRMCVPRRVDECFASNQQCFLAYDRMQISVDAYRADDYLALVKGLQLLAFCGKRFRECNSCGCGVPQILDPRAALDGGADGLDFYRKIATEAKLFLKQDGKIMLEFGDGQADAIKRIFETEKWIVEAVKEDYSQRARILIAHK